MKQILVPPKFAIGHLVLSEKAIFHYKQSSYYDRASQFTLLWNDPQLNIWWPVRNPILSRRDQGFESVFQFKKMDSAWSLKCAYPHPKSIEVRL